MPYPVEETIACVFQEDIREARTHEMMIGGHGHILADRTEARGAKQGKHTFRAAVMMVNEGQKDADILNCTSQCSTGAVG